MQFFRATLRVRATLSQPITSGGLWGQMACAVALMEGDAGVSCWLEGQQREPWLLSSAMPQDFLPRPLLQPMSRRDASEEDLRKLGTLRQLHWIPEQWFSSHRGALNEKILLREIQAGLTDAEWKLLARPHNTIDRLTSRPVEDGGLYFDEVLAPGKEGAMLQVYLGLPSAAHLEQARALLELVGAWGAGGKASTGCGAFELDGLKPVDALFAKSGTRRLSLSHGVLGPEMKEPRYRLHPQDGKVGPPMASRVATPFKYPLLLLNPGATFSSGQSEIFGRILGGSACPIHVSPEILHHALHLSLAFVESPP